MGDYLEGRLETQKASKYELRVYRRYAQSLQLSFLQMEECIHPSQVKYWLLKVGGRGVVWGSDKI